jgi:amidase
MSSFLILSLLFILSNRLSRSVGRATVPSSTRYDVCGQRRTEGGLVAGAVDGFTSATGMMRALRSKEVSAAELLELHIERIERLNGPLNAVVIKDYERARTAAKAADAARARGEDGALLGLPLTIKDAIDVQGLPTTCGVVERAETYPERDARIVASARAAGAVIMGKTNVPANAADWQTENLLFGRTGNPWNLDRVPGGSSGGAAAAVGAGLVPLEYGSDIGGSIRYPAAWCGVYGHRPSSTAIPDSGHFPGSPLPNPTLQFNTLGPIARTAEDLALGFETVAGPDIGEEVGWRLELPAARHTRLSEFRVGIYPGADWRPVDPQIVAAIEELATALRKAGATVSEAQPEGFGDGRDHNEVFVSIGAAIQGSRLPIEERKSRISSILAGTDPFGPTRAHHLEATAAEYIALHARREQYRARWRAFFREWDVVLAPIVIAPAPPHSALPSDQRVAEFDGKAVSFRVQSSYAGLSIMTGIPGTAIPIGMSADGLPISIQVLGPYLEDRTTIEFARLVGQEIGGYQRPPGYD